MKILAARLLEICIKNKIIIYDNVAIFSIEEISFNQHGVIVVFVQNIILSAAVLKGKYRDFIRITLYIEQRTTNQTRSDCIKAAIIKQKIINTVFTCCHSNNYVIANS